MTRIFDSFTRIEKAVLLCCVFALIFFAGGFWARAKTNEALPPVFAEAKSGALQTTPKSAPLLVHVAGAVRKPSVISMPADARTSDALKLAGGATKNADLNSINLAQKLKDGEQIHVRAKGETPFESSSRAASGKRSKASAKLPSRPVNVNTAGDADLQTLPGIGPATAAEILKARAKKRFRSLDDLDEVKGLGPKKLEKLKPYVTF